MRSVNAAIQAKSVKGSLKLSVVRIRPAGLPAFTLWVGAQHMVINQQVMVAHALGCLDEIAHHNRVRPQLRLWINHSIFHDNPPSDSVADAPTMLAETVRLCQTLPG